MADDMQFDTDEESSQMQTPYDAILYLNQIRSTFHDRPEVYRDFLGIMHALKLHYIDVLGLITRVSILFRRHPQLIIGFNAFLPPGYKIEVHPNQQGHPFQVHVTMPNSTSTQTSSISQPCPVGVGPAPTASLPSQPTNPPPILHIIQDLTNRYHALVNDVTNNSSTVHPTSCPPPIQPVNNPHIPAAVSQPQRQVIQNSRQTQQYQPFNNPHITAAVSQPQNGVIQDSNSRQTQQNQPINYNHAINFINQIRNRFQGQPDKYIRFLEILHRYQRLQRNLIHGNHTAAGSYSGGSGVDPAGNHLTVAEIYSQIARLFENQEDLLAEFRPFLPSALEQQSSQGYQNAAVNSNNADNIPRDHRYPDRERDNTGIGDMNRSQNTGQPRSLPLSMDHNHPAFHGPSQLHNTIIREILEIFHLLSHL